MSSEEGREEGAEEERAGSRLSWFRKRREAAKKAKEGEEAQETKERDTESSASDKEEFPDGPDTAGSRLSWFQRRRERARKEKEEEKLRELAEVNAEDGKYDTKGKTKYDGMKTQEKVKEIAAEARRFSLLLAADKHGDIEEAQERATSVAAMAVAAAAKRRETKGEDPEKYEHEGFGVKKDSKEDDGLASLPLKSYTGSVAPPKFSKAMIAEKRKVLADIAKTVAPIEEGKVYHVPEGHREGDEEGEEEEEQSKKDEKGESKRRPVLSWKRKKE